MRRKLLSERNQLELFRALPGDIAPRDAQDLMAYPFSSLAKTTRIVSIDFRAGAIIIRVEAVPEHGMATIWDADVLIRVASQIVEVRDTGLKTSRPMAATPYEILTFVGRGTSVRDYDLLKAGLDWLQSATVLTSIRQPAERRRHRFSWINEWKETADANGRPFGLGLILPDWFHAGILSPLKHIAYDVRQIVQRQALAGYQLVLTRDPNGTERLNFAAASVDPLTARLRRRGLNPNSEDNL